MTDTAPKNRTRVDEGGPEPEESTPGPIPVDDWLEQAVTITSDIIVQTGRNGDTSTMNTADEAVLDHDAEDTPATDAEPVGHGFEVADVEPAGVDHAPDDGAMADVEPAGVDGAVTDAEQSGDDGAVADREAGGFHEDIDDIDDGRVLIGARPTGASDDYSIQPYRVGGGPVRHYGRRSVVSALAFAVALIVLGGGLGFFIADYLPDKWTAEAEVVLDPGIESVDRYLSTQQVLMQSSVILDRALEDLPVDREYVEEELKVFPIEASSALGVTFVDPDPELARDVVAAVLTSFMAEVDSTSADVSTPVYRQRIEDLMAERQELEESLRGFEAANAEAEANEQPLPYPAEVRRMALESEQLLAQISSLETAILAEQVATLTRSDATVVTEPRVLSEPTWPNPLVFAALGLLVGLAVAAIALFLLASRRAS